MAQRELVLNKLEDLIPYLGSLKELWEREDRFHPVLKLLESLYKEAADEVLFTQRDGSQAQAFKLAERAAQAKVYAILHGLPEAVASLKKELEDREEQKKKFAAAQESAFAGKAEQRSNEDLEYTQSYAAYLERKQQRKQKQEDQKEQTHEIAVAEESN